MTMMTTALLLASSAMGSGSEPDAVIEVHADKPTVTLPSTLYGIFYEDINHAADGGLYAELVRNRSFAYYPAGQSLEEGNAVRRTGSCWEKVELGDGVCQTFVDDADPLHEHNAEHVVVRIVNPGTGVGVANTGYNGIYVLEGDTYDFSFYARRTASLDSPFRISIENEAGEVAGQGTIERISTEWDRYAVPIRATKTLEDARLVITTTGEGEVRMDLISLFPRKTFMNRVNGLRPDLAQAIADMKPGVFRFPGGCIVHGGVGHRQRLPMEGDDRGPARAEGQVEPLGVSPVLRAGLLRVHALLRGHRRGTAAGLPGRRELRVPPSGGDPDG